MGFRRPRLGEPVTIDRFLASSRVGRWQWPWAIAGTALTAVLIIAAAQATAPLESWLAALQGAEDEASFLVPGRLDSYAGFVLFAFSLTLPPALVLAAVHRVDPWQVLAPGGRWQWSLFARATLAFLTVVVAGQIVGLIREPGSYRWLDRGLSHVPWLLLALPVILLQSFAEEYLFKGYLLRVWGAVLPFRFPIVMAVAVLFTAGHAINDDVAADLVFNLMFFLAAEILTLVIFLRTESLDAVTGLHWMNNVWAMALMATEPGQSTALALSAYTDPMVAAGRSRLTDPYSYLELGTGLALLWLLLSWPGSPFYLAPRRQQPATLPPAREAETGPFP